MGVKIIRKNNPEKHSILREIIGLVFLFLGAFTVITLISYAPNDPSLFTVSGMKPQNWGGILGSYWASMLLQFFGAAAPAIALFFVFLAVATFRRISRTAWLIMGVNNFLLLLAVCSMLGVISAPFEFRGDSFTFGGLVGKNFTRIFSHYLSIYGTGLLAGFLLLFTISLATRLHMRELAILIWGCINRTASLIMGALLYAGKKISLVAGKLKNTRPLYMLAQRLEKIRLPVRTSETVPESLQSPATTAAAKEPIIARLTGLLRRRVYQQASSQPGAVAGATAAYGRQSLAAPVQTPDLNDPSADIAIHAPRAPRLSHEKNDRPARKNLTGFLHRMHSATEKSAEKARRELEDDFEYELPGLDLLKEPDLQEISFDKRELISKSKLLEKRLADFRVEGKVTAVKPGPVVTMYEFKPGPGVKVNSITNLSDDLALALSAQSVRIVAPVPGRDVVGIEIPNNRRQKVFLREIIEADVFEDEKYRIPIAIGKDILGEPMVADLKKMPHLLVAGATGSGKSVFINTVICSLLYKFTPDELRLILVDPKQLELNHYNNLPHLLLPVVFEPKKASQALKWAVNEMENRYRLIARSGMRDIAGYNEKLESIGEEALTELIRRAPDGHDLFPEGTEAEHLPQIVIVIDELADLMMTAKSEVESSICRLAQKARAAGIHLILATQRPSVDVVTGLIKANLPSRISFRLSSKNDSRTIFDSMGAERLVGNGDMLFMPPGESTLVRMHGAFIDESEVEDIADFWREQSDPDYREAEILADDEDEGGIEFDDAEDSLFGDALDIAFNSGCISASMLQRRLRVGYNRAARMVELMESKGIVGPADGSKPREVLLERD